MLATPGSNPRMIAKALASDADVVMIDLEDAVAPDAKAGARATVAEALREGDWRRAAAHLPHERARYALVRP